MNENVPFVSVCLFSYNQEKFIEEAVRGVLSQDYDNMEIIISDDKSTDGTFDIIKTLVSQYNGRHNVVINQNDYNLGITKHFCKVVYEIAKGEIIIAAAGDDVSLPNRTKEIVDVMLRNPEVSAVSSQFQAIDEHSKHIYDNQSDFNGGTTIITLEDYLAFDYVMYPGCSRAFRRKVLEAFPPLSFSYAEDSPFFLRSIYVGSYAYIRKTLVLYRIHEKSITGKLSTGEDKMTVAKWRETTGRQFLEDFNLAVDKGLIPANMLNEAEKKLQWIMRWFQPKPYRKWIICRIYRKCCHLFS